MLLRRSRTRGRRPRHLRGRWALACLLAVGALGLRTSARPVEAAEPSEYAVKAAFLYHFAQLVEWPQTQDAADKPFVIALVGEDVFGRLLDDVVNAEKAHNRSIRVLRARTAAGLGLQPDLLFVGAKSPGDVQRSLAQVAGAPVLTVGESEGFAERGGMIGFRLTPDGRVAFDINLKAADEAGLRLSSQLLKIARIVGPRP